MNSINSSPVSPDAVTNERIVMHALTVDLSERAGFTVQAVQGKTGDGGYSGFRCYAPVIDTGAVAEKLISDESFGAAIVKYLEAKQRELMRLHERNGLFSFNQSLDVARVDLDALAAYLATSGASAVRITKELIEAIIPSFRRAVAARWAEVKRVPDSMSEGEILMASRGTQDIYLTYLDGVRKDSLIDSATSEKFMLVLNMCAELDAVKGNETLRNAIAAVIAKQVSLDKKRDSAFGDAEIPDGM
jgi:hypothetical protein